MHCCQNGVMINSGAQRPAWGPSCCEFLRQCHVIPDLIHVDLTPEVVVRGSCLMRTVCLLLLMSHRWSSLCLPIPPAVVKPGFICSS